MISKFQLIAKLHGEVVLTISIKLNQGRNGFMLLVKGSKCFWVFMKGLCL